MKNCLWAGLVGLALLAAAAPARADGCFSFCWHPCKVNVDCSACCKITCCQNPAQCGPWYLYWPMEAHFGPPAPTGFPNWPPPMTLPGLAAAPAAVPAPVPPPGTQAAPQTFPPAPQQAFPPAPQPVRPMAYQPVGYFYQVPSYWYGR
jgi:hypothetical protein